jgi:DNA invertase Pin-like site-specific DNA recombinase
MDLGRPLDGYIRVSRVGGREGDSFISPDVQRETIQRWADLRGVQIGEWFTDLDQSGGKLKRPGLDEALERIEAEDSGGLAVARLDRLSRAGVGDALKLVEWIHDHGGRIAAIDLGIDPTTPFGEFAMTIMLALARMERRRIGDNWAVAQEKAVARGVHVASATPTGYQRRDDGLLEPHPDHAPAITALFRMRAAGASWGALVDHMNRENVAGPYGALNWTTRAVQHILANRAYLGEARYGEHRNPDAHQPLTDRSTWELAQVAKGAPTVRSSQPALLAGLLRCAGCRHVMKPDTMRLHDGTKARIYRCRGKHSVGVCGDRSSTMERVIAPLVEARFFHEVGELAARSVELTADIEQLEDAALKAEADLTAFRDDERIAGALGPERYVDGLAKRAAAADRAQRALAEARGKAGSVPLNVDLHEIWGDLETAEKQKLLMSVFDCIVLRSAPSRATPIEDRVTFIPRGEAPDDLPRRGKRFPLRAWDDLPGPAGVASP